MITASWEQTTLPTILPNYKLEDIFSADEFGLFCRALPDKTLHLKSEKCVGGKHSKIRLTGMAAANAVGEKLPAMFVIGKSARPRCFIGVKNLPCRYRAQKKSWMDSSLFEEWLRELDRKFEREGMKIALIVDNCPAHPHVEGLKAINLCSSLLLQRQIPSQWAKGLFRSLKAHYRVLTVQLYILAVDKKNPLPYISMLVAMNMLTAAWDLVSEKKTIQKCLKSAGMSKQLQQCAVNDEDVPFKELNEELDNLRQRVPNLASSQVGTDSLITCDDDLTATCNLVPPSDSDILAEFLPSDDVEDDETEVKMDEPPPKRPSKDELYQAIGLLQTYSLFVEDQVDDYKSDVLKLSRIINTNRLAAERQRLLTDCFYRD